MTPETCPKPNEMALRVIGHHGSTVRERQFTIWTVSFYFPSQLMLANQCFRNFSRDILFIFQLIPVLGELRWTRDSAINFQKSPTKRRSGVELSFWWRSVLNWKHVSQDFCGKVFVRSYQ